MVLFQELYFGPHFVLYSTCLFTTVNVVVFFVYCFAFPKLLLAGSPLLKYLHECLFTILPFGVV